MKHFILLIFLSLWVAPKTFAVAIYCSGGSQKMTINLPVPSNNKSMVTGLAGLSGQFREIASWKSFTGGLNSAKCYTQGGGAYRPGLPYASAVYQVVYVEPYQGRNSLSYNGHYIFPTSVKGIGISFQDLGSMASQSTGLSGPVEIPSFSNPAQIFRTTYAWTDYSSLPLKFGVSLWKIPTTDGHVDIPSSGKLSFNGPTLVTAQWNDNSADFYSNPPNTGSYSLANSWTMGSYEIKGDLDISFGTCSLNNKTVAMGLHYVNKSGGVSDWKDASFTVQCPAGWGYGVDYALSSNTAVASTSGVKYKSSGLVISVLPLRGATIQDAVNGIITLDSSSTATGYGVQLAWGDISTLPTTNAAPSKAVSLDQAVDAATISDYVTRSYNFGEVPPTQLIKMAARYIRTPGAASAGTANSAVEVIASYN